MTGLWGGLPPRRPLPTSPRLLDQMGQLHQGRLRDDRRQASWDPSLTTARPAFARSLAPRLGLVLGCWD